MIPYKFVENVLVQTGGLAECKRGDDGIYDPLDSTGVQDAIDAHARLVAAGEIDCTLEEWETRVRAVVDDHGDECPNCP